MKQPIKVTQDLVLPKKVADELTNAIEYEGSWAKVYEEVHNGCYPEVYNHFEFNMDSLLSAMVNGFTIAPEDKVKELFLNHLSQIQEKHDYSDGVTNGIYDTLNLLGITIEGVND